MIFGSASSSQHNKSANGMHENAPVKCFSFVHILGSIALDCCRLLEIEMYSISDYLVGPRPWRSYLAKLLGATHFGP